MVGDTGAILFIDGGSGDSTTSDGLDRLGLDWNQIKKLRFNNKERILHHNLGSLYLHREMSCVCCCNEHSGRFRNLPEHS